MMSQTRKKSNKAIAQMNNGKSSGVDGIPVEVLKYGRDRLKELVFEVISHVWDTSGPQDWGDAILESLFKKGERLWQLPRYFYNFNSWKGLCKSPVDSSDFFNS